MKLIKVWLHAARLRTLPLALACVLMGGFLAYGDGRFDMLVFVLAVLTTVILQVLSNFANDYGDYSSGVDLIGRVGPERAMQGGHINSRQMKIALIITSILALLSGVSLLGVADIPATGRFTLLVLGIISIGAAITYTIGKRPYGYIGLGDLSVFIFFGLVGVLGSHYVIYGDFLPRNILMAAPIGLFSIGVLNLNNIRDMEADKINQKNTIPVTLGQNRAKIYHALLLFSGWLLAITYTLLYYKHWTQFLFLLSLPLFIRNFVLLWNKEGKEIDPLLKQLALATFVFVLLAGAGMVVGNSL